MCLEQVNQLLPLLTSRSLLLMTRFQVYSTCARSVMLHAAEIRPGMVVIILNRLCSDEMSALHVYNIKANNEVSSGTLL